MKRKLKLFFVTRQIIAVMYVHLLKKKKKKKKKKILKIKNEKERKQN